MLCEVCSASTAVPSSCLFFKRQTRYAQTSDVFKNKQLGGTAAEASLFIDLQDQSACLKRYFALCDRIPTKTYSGAELFVYQCVNNQRGLAYVEKQ